MNKPLQIVMTPVRNEAWILPAFLRATSLWADYIIIADQMSTDGSRELYQQFDKVIVIDNTNPNFNEAERQSMLVAKAREVAAGRDTLLWALDADEILAANWMETDDWRKIVHSKPGAVFWFRWAQVTHDKRYYNNRDSYPFLFHDDGIEPHGNYVREMHSMRIPYPLDEHDMTYLEELRILHFGPAPLKRVRAKERFYMFVDWQVNHRSPYILGRNYINGITYPKELNELPQEWIYTHEKDGWNLWDNVELDETHCWMDDYIYERLNTYPMRTLVKLPIWESEFLAYYKMKDPRPWHVKLIHKYIKLTQSYKGNFIVRAIDKILKKCVK